MDLLHQVQSAGSCMKDEGGYKWMEFNYLFEWLENSEIDVSESSFIIYVLPFICMMELRNQTCKIWSQSLLTLSCVEWPPPWLSWIMEKIWQIVTCATCALHCNVQSWIPQIYSQIMSQPYSTHYKSIPYLRNIDVYACSMHPYPSTIVASL